MFGFNLNKNMEARQFLSARGGWERLKKERSLGEVKEEETFGRGKEMRGVWER